MAQIDRVKERTQGSAEVGHRVQERVGDAGLKVARSIHNAVLEGGEPARNVADVLHGSWLGHPLHPSLTDATIGAWTMGAFFDAWGAATGDDRAHWAADRLVEVGVATAVPTALAGTADFSTVKKDAAATTTVHALLNATALGLMTTSVVQRRRGRRAQGLLFSALGLGANLFSAWLGGHLTYRDRVGVDHSERFAGPRQWTPVAQLADLPVGRARRVEIEGKGVLLYREGAQVYAIGSVCSHAGGPLEEGEIRDCQVRCPWHDSVFDLRDGSIVHGPATRPQTAFEARTVGSRVEVRLPPGGSSGARL